VKALGAAIITELESRLNGRVVTSQRRSSGPAA
jgi:hypothetical protein